MNGITGGTGTNRPSVTPYTPAETAGLKATGFAFSEKGGMDWDSWINTARSSKDPSLQAQYRELVDLAGGRSDNGSLKTVMQRVQQLQLASSPHATAADQIAALRGMSDQLTTTLTKSGIIDTLQGPAEIATQLLRNDPIFGKTEWGKALNTVLSTQKQSLAFQQGLAMGIWEGGKALVMGVVSLAGKSLQYGADTSAFGWAGDRLRGVTGDLPGWLDATIPSAERGAASTAALKAMGQGIGHYLSTNSPADMANDIGNAIGKAWDGLKADHAKAAAQGPEAEARWWGQTIGRVAFEVGATFIPVAGQAGKVAKGAQVIDKVADGARAVDKIADGARVVETGARGAETILARARRILGDLPLNSKSLDDLYQAGKLTMDEARTLAKHANWKDATNQWIWPPDNGFHNPPRAHILEAGQELVIDRFGSPRGRFVSPADEAIEARALAPDTDLSSANYHRYRVEGDIKVDAGIATPWFDQPGGAIQYKLPDAVENLIKNSKLVEL